MKRKIGVAITIPDVSGKGGAETDTISLAENLDKKRFYPLIFSRKTEPGISVPVVFIKKYYYNTFTRKTPFIFPFLCIYVFLQCLKKIKEFRIDIVHIQTGSLGSLPILFAAKVLSIPVLVTVHGLIDIEYTCSSLFNRYLRLADYVVAVQDITEDRLLKFGVKRVRAIPFMVDTNTFIQADEQNDIPTIAYLGGGKKLKGVSFLLQVIPIIEKKQTTRFLIIGDLGHYEHRFRELAEEWPGLIELRGAIPHSEVASVINKSSLVLAYGKGLCETLSCGKNVVLFFDPTDQRMRDLCLSMHGNEIRMGFVYNFSLKKDSFVESILKLLHSNLGCDAARNYTVSTYSSKVVSQKYEDLYLQILRSKERVAYRVGGDKITG